MSNPGLIILNHLNQLGSTIKNFTVEDNIGESIHVHFNNIRVDFTIAEFLAFADQFKSIPRRLSEYGYPAFHLIDPSIILALGPRVRHIDKIELVARQASSLKLIHNAESSQSHGNQIVLFGDEPYVRFGGTLAAGLLSKHVDGVINVIVIHFSDDRWRHSHDNFTLASNGQTTNMTPSPHSVFIIAGISGSGKSTLLRDALENNRPVFGDQFQPMISKFRLPVVFPENDVHISDRLSRNTWIHEIDLIRLHLMNEPLRDFLVHFDLFWFLATAHKWNRTVPSVNDAKEFSKFLSTISSISEIFKLCFKLLPFKGANCMVRTLKPEYETLCTRWRERAQNIDVVGVPEFRFLDQYVFSNSSTGKKYCENIYKGWDNAMTTFNRKAP